MINNILKEKLIEIQNAVADLEEPLKSKAIDKLLESEFNSTKKNKHRVTRRNKKVSKNSNIFSKRNEAIKKDGENDKKILETINRTEHLEIHSMETSLDKALYILKIMKEKGHDGLNPSQIKAILTEIFRIKANVPAISMALIKDKFYTEKEITSYKGSKANKYKIMHSGEEYIQKKLDNINLAKDNPIKEENPKN